ncbi:MAG: hypothetical protein GQ546_04000 [Gammaproteobacteria bacterium]|nr:hypothetical protein [Gammaproteobacteria bacterium]
MDDKNQNKNTYLLNIERIMELSQSMTDEEKEALHNWERIYVTGDGLSTSDWPGWESVINRRSH